MHKTPSGEKRKALKKSAMEREREAKAPNTTCFEWEYFLDNHTHTMGVSAMPGMEAHFSS